MTAAAAQYMPIPAWDHLADDAAAIVMTELEFRADSPYHVRLSVEGGAGVDVPLDVLAAGRVGRAECAALSAWPMDEESIRWDVRVPGAEPVALRVPRSVLASHLDTLPEIAHEPDWDAFARECAGGSL
ncbi:hypothetical protein SAMN05421874_128139 [Nonomuraea maritima]|uniref:Streptomyces sporulation and cell division protein, SsgA n=1 Tax=Nonomuraea maritima TaxID=683260 RepID=A0A1G9MQ88_9ACTN|nr:hypothetical protein [Nonomuraea maritima]SDL76456.1 hypothetical protein SAMN05421874_128139 [Nonomuraea maritima]